MKSLKYTNPLLTRSRGFAISPVACQSVVTLPAALRLRTRAPCTLNQKSSPLLTAMLRGLPSPEARSVVARPSLAIRQMSPVLGSAR